MSDILESKQISESDLYLALEDLVIYTIKRQINDVLDKTIWNELEWAREACTIRFQGPRQCGHSTAVVKLCKYIFKNPLIVVPSGEMVNLLMEKFAGQEAPDIISVYQLNNVIGRSNYDGVIVDTASAVDGQWIEEIYRMFSRVAYASGSFCFALVG